MRDVVRVQTFAHIIEHRIIIAALADIQGVERVEVGRRDIRLFKVDHSVFFGISDLFTVEGDAVLYRVELVLIGDRVVVAQGGL